MKIMASGPITSRQIDWETRERVTDFIYLGSKITTDGDWNYKIKRACSLEEKLRLTRQHIKKQRLYFANKCPYSQRYDFASSHVSM